MAIKKKMAGKPAMVKKKMQEGGTAAKSDTTRAEYNNGKSAELKEVTKRETARDRIRNFYNSDFYGADKAKTKFGRTTKKVGNTIAKIAFTPHMLAEQVMRTGETAKANKKDLKNFKVGGKISKKVAPKMAMKKMSKKK